MEFPGFLEDQASSLGRLKILNVQYDCNPFNIPDKVMNYFVRGTTFGENLSIEIEEVPAH